MKDIVKKLIDFLVSVLPEVVNSYIFTAIRDFDRTKLNKKELQIPLNVLGTEFTLQLIEGNSNQISTYYKMYKENSIYEETMVYLLDELLDSDLLTKKNRETVFFDIGAYAGYYSNFVAKKLKSNSLVFAIESNPIYYQNMIETNRLNNFDNLFIHNEIFSNKKELMLAHEEMVATRETVVKQSNKAMTYHEKRELNNILRNGKKLNSITLDNFCAERNINPSILKIDVHGSEGKVLEGSRDFLDNSVQVIFLELHQQHELNKYSDGMSKYEILNLLYEKDFNTHLISPFRYNEKNIEYQLFKETGKLLKLKIDKSNYREILFDRNNTDLFILCTKRDINIENLDCLSALN